MGSCTDVAPLLLLAALASGGCGEGGVAALPECPASPADWRVVVSSDTDRSDVEYDMVVREVSRSILELDLDGAPKIGMEVPAMLPERSILPAVGDRVWVRGGSCDEDNGYFRVRDASERLLWEGGSPSCPANAPGAYGFALLGMRPAAETHRCRTAESGGCCCETREDWEVTLETGGGVEAIADGDARSFEIDGQPYEARALRSVATFDGPCSSDATGVHGDAYVVRLAP